MNAIKDMLRSNIHDYDGIRSFMIVSGKYYETAIKLIEEEYSVKKQDINITDFVTGDGSECLKLVFVSTQKKPIPELYPRIYCIGVKCGMVVYYGNDKKATTTPFVISSNGCVFGKGVKWDNMEVEE